MVAGKSYCFMQFTDKSSAEKVVEKMNGKATLGQNSAPLLMSYCKMISTTITNQQSSSTLPDGLILIEDCISRELEQEILRILKWNENEDDNKLKNRRVQHFGYEFIYGTNTVDPRSPLDRKIPQTCDEIWTALKTKCPAFAHFRPDQLTVNCYEPGNGIPPHCDTHSCFEDPIVSLSLGSSVLMELRQPRMSRKCSVLLPQRSLLIMSGESRFGWTHGITPRTSDIIKINGFLTAQRREMRVSLTFRTLKIPPCCDCDFPELCDVVAQPGPELEMTEQLAAKLEIEKVHKVYNEIGSHFSETRHSPWPNVESFIKGLASGAVMIDVGCGNGKYLGLNDGIVKMGCDRSDALLQVCLEREFNVFQCDCLALPLRDSSVDAAISIAVIHHLATSERRMTAINEMVRVLVTGGTALIYVWAKDQQKDNKKSTYLLQHQQKTDDNRPETATFTIDTDEIQLPIHRNRTQFNHANVLVPWKLKQKEIPHDQQKIFLRYYHVFEDGELEELCKRNSNVEIVKSYYDQGNHCVVIKKI